MVRALTYAASALNAHITAMNAVARNVANINTAGFRPARTTFSEGENGGVSAAVHTPRNPVKVRIEAYNALRLSGTDITSETVNEIEFLRSFQLNAKTFKTSDEMLGTIVDLRG